MSHWSFAASAPVLVIGLLIWVGAGWLCWLHWRRRAGQWAVGALEGWRFLLITLLILTLFRPEWVQEVERTEDPRVAILYDRTGSMETRDVAEENEVVTRADWIDRKRENRFWSPLEEAGTAEIVHREIGEDEDGDSPTRGTDLNGALEDVRRRESNLKAVLLLSDGDWNIGQSPMVAASRYRQDGIPIFTVGVGRAAPLPDLKLKEVSPPSYGLLGEQISIPFTVVNNLSTAVETEAELIPEEGEPVTKEIRLPAGGERQDSIIWSPRSEGERELTLRIPVEPEEELEENNEQRFRVTVRVETLNVLVVDSRPRWEYRYLRNALARDPGVDLHCVLYHPRIGQGGGRHYLSSFPGSKEMLSRYDVVFLGDVGIGEDELTAEEADRLAGLVAQQGSGLVFLPGSRGRQLSLLESELQALYPVALDSDRPQGEGLRNETTLSLTREGRRHWLTRLSASDEENRRIWESLPGFYWSAAVTKSRPGATVLGVHSSLRNRWGRMPLLVTRPHGNGQVLFMGTDSAWRWRRGVEDKYHYRFWSQVVRWMAHRRHLAGREGVRLAFNPESPKAGDTVFLQATVLDQAGFPVQDGEVVGEVTTPGDRLEQLDFTSTADGWGVFEARFSPEQGGAYQVRIDAPQYGRELETVLEVDERTVEEQGRPLNDAILERVATASGGVTGSMTRLEELVRQVRLLPEPEPRLQRVRLWSHPLWGGMILLFLAVYWTGRKMAGML